MQKNIKIISPLLLTLLGALTFNPAFAQSANFEGASIDIGFSSGKNTGNTAEAEFGNFKKTDAVGVVDLSYNEALGNDWLIGVGATFDTNKADFGSVFYETSEPYSVSGTASSTFKNHYSIYIKPMYAVSESTAVYAKVGYHSGIFSVVSNDADAPGTSRTRINGVGYSLGIQQMLGKNLYMKLEAQFIQYSNKDFAISEGTSGIKPTSTSGIIAVGYKF